MWFKKRPEEAPKRKIAPTIESKKPVRSTQFLHENHEPHRHVTEDPVSNWCRTISDVMTSSSSDWSSSSSDCSSSSSSSSSDSGSCSSSSD